MEWKVKVKDFSLKARNHHLMRHFLGTIPKRKNCSTGSDQNSCSGQKQKPKEQIVDAVALAIVVAVAAAAPVARYGVGGDVVAVAERKSERTTTQGSDSARHHQD